MLSPNFPHHSPVPEATGPSNLARTFRSTMEGAGARIENETTDSSVDGCVRSGSMPLVTFAGDGTDARSQFRSVAGAVISGGPWMTRTQVLREHGDPHGRDWPPRADASAPGESGTSFSARPIRPTAEHRPLARETSSPGLRGCQNWSRTEGRKARTKCSTSGKRSRSGDGSGWAVAPLRLATAAVSAPCVAARGVSSEHCSNDKTTTGRCKGDGGAAPVSPVTPPATAAWRRHPPVPSSPRERGGGASRRHRRSALGVQESRRGSW
jgi:hypothetical protein